MQLKKVSGSLDISTAVSALLYLLQTDLIQRDNLANI